EFSYNKILNDLKKEFCCNGTVLQDPELGQVIQLHGDQCKNADIQPCGIRFASGQKLN
ncbi:Os02g0151501, partial [Oryza sativa Japonica Group]